MWLIARYPAANKPATAASWWPEVARQVSDRIPKVASQLLEGARQRSLRLGRGRLLDGRPAGLACGAGLRGARRHPVRADGGLRVGRGLGGVRGGAGPRPGRRNHEIKQDHVPIVSNVCTCQRFNVEDSSTFQRFIVSFKIEKLGYARWPRFQTLKR